MIMVNGSHCYEWQFDDDDDDGFDVAVNDDEPVDFESLFNTLRRNLVVIIRRKPGEFFLKAVDEVSAKDIASTEASTSVQILILCVNLTCSFCYRVPILHQKPLMWQLKSLLMLPLMGKSTRYSWIVPNSQPSLSF